MCNLDFTLQPYSFRSYSIQSRKHTCWKSNMCL